VINLHYLTAHCTTVLPHKMAMVLRPQIRHVTSDHIDYTIAISISDSSSVRYRGDHISYDIVHERTSDACAAHTPQRLRLIDVARRAHRPWLSLFHVPCGRPIMQRIGSLGWGLGDGSCTSSGLNYACRKAHCTRRTAQCQSRNDINTAAPVQCPVSTHSDISASVANTCWQSVSSIN